MMQPDRLGPSKAAKEISVVMPPSQQILENLRKDELLGILPTFDRFFSNLALTTAGIQMGPSGFVRAWFAAADATLPKKPEKQVTIPLGLVRNFDRIIDAIAPDKMFAAETKAYWRELADAGIQQQRIAKEKNTKPNPPPPQQKKTY